MLATRLYFIAEHRPGTLVKIESARWILVVLPVHGFVNPGHLVQLPVHNSCFEGSLAAEEIQVLPVPILSIRT